MPAPQREMHNCYSLTFHYIYLYTPFTIAVTQVTQGTELHCLHQSHVHDHLRPFTPVQIKPYPRRNGCHQSMLTSPSSADPLPCHSPSTVFLDPPPQNNPSNQHTWPIIHGILQHYLFSTSNQIFHSLCPPSNTIHPHAINHHLFPHQSTR